MVNRKNFHNCVSVCLGTLRTVFRVTILNCLGQLYLNNIFMVLIKAVLVSSLVPKKNPLLSSYEHRYIICIQAKQKQANSKVWLQHGVYKNIIKPWKQFSITCSILFQFSSTSLPNFSHICPSVKFLQLQIPGSDRIKATTQII